MAMVAYKGKRIRIGDGDTQMIPYPATSLYFPNAGTAPGRYNKPRGGVVKYNNKRKRRYTINSTYNTRTNPVYPRPEVKISDTIFGTIAAPIQIPSIGTVPVCMNNLGSGTTPGQRVGAQIASKSVYYQFIINFGSATAAVAVRFILWWDRQCNGVLPATFFGAGLLENTTIPIVSPLALGNRNRYYIVADERITLSPQGTNIQFVSGFRKINQLSTYEPTGANNFPFTGGLFYSFISDEPTSSPTTNPTYYGIFRFRYMDT